MKRFIFLLIASVTLLTSFTQPPVIQEDSKDNWVYSLGKELKEVKKVTSDFLTLGQILTTCADGGTAYGPGSTNSVSVGRYWNIAYNTDHGTQIHVVYIPANTTSFYSYLNQVGWPCYNSVYETSAWLLNGTGNP